VSDRHNPAGFRLFFLRPVVLSAVLGALFVGVFGAPGAASAQPLVVLDPGHGGADPGAVGCGLEEEDAVLDVSLRLRVLLEAAGVRVTMTRDTDAAVGLSARAALANSMGADVFVSNHSNSNAGAPASGTETWIANAASARSETLAAAIQAEMIGAWGLPDRGVKNADFVVVRDTTMPAALAEMAFTNRCMPDAALLMSDVSRQQMAEAQARAILAWLGIAPGTDGTARGVVFEDQGVGTEDLTVRIPGASVRVIETSAMATAGSPDGDWSFALPAGSYTLEASAPGYVTGTRSCVVTSGSTSWCSIGLFPESVVVDAGASDAGSAVDVGVLPADAGPSSDTGTEMRDMATCGCRAGRSAVDRWPRCCCSACWSRRFSNAGGTKAGGTKAGGTKAGGTSRALVELPAGVGLAAGAGLHADRVRSRGVDVGTAHRARARLHRTRALVRRAHRGAALRCQEAASPILSPDGRFVLLSSADLTTLTIIEVESGEQRVLATGPRVGLEPRWQPDGSVAFRGPMDTATAIPSLAVTRAGEPTAVLLRTHGVHAWVESGDGEDSVLFRDGHETRRISRGGDRYLMPSSGGGWITYWGAATGVFLYRVEARDPLVVGDPLLDPGASFGHPRLDASGRLLVFERTTDEGHVFTSGSVLLADLSSTPVRVMTIPTAPVWRACPASRAVDEEGHARLSFLLDGELVVAELVLLP
jgi:N-acetylmuramoyl-L-alanine amidase